MQKNFENIGNVGTGMQIFMIFMSCGRFLCVSWFFWKLIYDFYLSCATVQNCNFSGRGRVPTLGFDLRVLAVAWTRPGGGGTSGGSLRSSRQAVACHPFTRPWAAMPPEVPSPPGLLLSRGGTVE